MRGAVAPEVFERLYRERADPWDFAHSVYERDRYEHTLDALLRPRYGRAFEPGCSVGELTVQLAQRCGQLFATDLVESAVHSARHRCRHQVNVAISQADLADGVPLGALDLIVLSEVGYYFSASRLGLIAEDLAARLAPNGELLAVHWLGDSTDHLLHGDEVHRILGVALALRWIKGERTDKYRLDTWIKT